MTRPDTHPRTLAQKLIARAAGRAHVDVGEIVNCQVDLAMFHDSSGPRRLKPMLEELGATIWDKSRVVLVLDHYVPEQDDESRRIVRIARDWAREQALPHVYDSIGICHVVLPQKGHIRPGMFCVGGDSHSPTGGAFGALLCFNPHWLGIAVNPSAVLLLGGFGALFGAFTSGVLIGSSTPNVHLRQFEADFEAGRLVLILDVPKQRVDELGALVKSHFPFIRDYQVDATIPAFP